MLKRNAKSKLNSGITSMEAKLPMILLVTLTDEISTDMQIGNSKKDRRRVFPSENMTSPEMKEPANARSIPPRIKIARKSRIFAGNLRLRNTMENRSNTLYQHRQYNRVQSFSQQNRGQGTRKSL